MPTYEFRCDDCGHVKETSRRDLAGEPCDLFGPGFGCGDDCAGTYKRVWHAPAIRPYGMGDLPT